MESLSYAFEGRALLFSDDAEFQLDGLIRNKNLLKKWDGEDAVESMGFVDPLSPDTAKKAFLSNQYLDSSRDDTNDHSGKSVQSASSITFNSFRDFGTKLSSSVNKVNEKFTGPKESDGNQFSMDNSSPEQSMSAKRSRITNYQTTVPTCQVFGCNQDLSSSKDYHKRHKVCDVHSKTPVVVVNGIQQRFCQQCSRFHILAEFDEGKRSCRKRLAGHNERRRKPQFDSHLGSTYLTTDASKTSLIFSRILPNGFFGLQYNEPTNHSQQLNMEEKPSQLFPNSVLHFHGVGKQYPSKNCLNAPSSLPECSMGPDSGFALSLLSPQSQNISSTSEGIPMVQPLISKQSDLSGLFTFQNSAMPFGESTISNSSGAEVEQLPVVSSTTVAAGSETSFSQERDTVDLLELSLHLQRVEEQRYYGDVKLENGIFCDSSVS